MDHEVSGAFSDLNDLSIYVAQEAVDGPSPNNRGFKGYNWFRNSFVANPDQTECLPLSLSETLRPLHPPKGEHN